MGAKQGDDENEGGGDELPQRAATQGDAAGNTVVEDKVDSIAYSGENSIDNAHGTPAAHACFGKKGDNDDAQCR